MGRFEKRYLLEQLIYGVIWLVILAIPFLMELLPDSLEEDYSFNWQILSRNLTVILLFFIIFLVHNYFLIPKLLFRKKILLYILSVLSIVIVVFTLDYNLMRTGMHNRAVNMRRMERVVPESIPPDREAEFQQLPPGAPQISPLQPDMRNRRPEFRGPVPRFMFGFFFSRTLIIAVLLGMNIAIKMIFKSLRDEEAIKELERHNLQSELEYLKYQINPHFFMNTLNNIYALIDINKEKAGKAVIELSKLMRYVLYEANRSVIPLSRELKFITNYVELMKLRYTEKVTVKLFLPDEIPEVEIAPLLYISFIENAFKHGVSYQSPSLVYVMLQVEENSLVFTCSNTNKGKNHEQYKGIGLDNIKKRLHLLYTDRYTLSINENTDSFDVLLIIPLK